MSFDVQSQRYVDFSEVEAIVPPVFLSREERLEQYPHVFDEDHPDVVSRETGEVELQGETRKHWRNAFVAQTSEALDFYEDLVERGVPKEDARFVLPLATPVNMTFSGNARTFLHLLDMRKKPNAQWEIRELSERLLEKLFEWMPYTFERYERMGPNKLAP